MHAVDVSPDLNFVRIDGSADETGGVVRAAALQVVGLSEVVQTDEALGDVEFIVGMTLEDGGEVLLDVGLVGFAVGIGFHVVQRTDEFDFHALFNQIVCHHVGAHEFPLCEDFFLKRRCEFLGGEIVEMAEDVIQQSACFLGCVFGGIEFLDVVEIGVAQFVDDVVGCLGIIFLNVVSDFDELIGGAGHGGEYDNFLFSIVDELAHAFHAFRGTHGGSAKFQDFHVLYI